MAGGVSKSPRPASIAELAASIDDAAGIYFVPAMLGLGAPYWDANARGAITGIGRHHTPAHMARAVLDAIAYQVADVFFAMQSAAEVDFDELLADGGATRNPLLMQFQADILGCPVLRSSNEELSAIGAAWLAGLVLGWWKALAELEAIAHDVDRFEPRMREGERKALYDGWKDAVANVRSGARERNDMSSSRHHLEAHAITRRYPGTIALDRVDFRVYRNQVNVLIGENGAGKSTLMRILAGVEQHDEGRLVLEGAEIRLRSPRRQRATALRSCTRNSRCCRISIWLTTSSPVAN